MHCNKGLEEVSGIKYQTCKINFCEELEIFHGDDLIKKTCLKEKTRQGAGYIDTLSSGRIKLNSDKPY